MLNVPAATVLNVPAATVRKGKNVQSSRDARETRRWSVRDIAAYAIHL